jgi:hypothetical protein
MWRRKVLSNKFQVSSFDTMASITNKANSVLYLRRIQRRKKNLYDGTNCEKKVSLPKVDFIIHYYHDCY